MVLFCLGFSMQLSDSSDIVLPQGYNFFLTAFLLHDSSLKGHVFCFGLSKDCLAGS